MAYYCRRLASILGRIVIFWAAWWILIVAVIFASCEGSGRELTPESWRGRGIIALLFFAAGYGTVMLVRGLSREMDRITLPPDP